MTSLPAATPEILKSVIRRQRFPLEIMQTCGIVLKLVREGKIPEQTLRDWFDQHLSAERDRALFGLAVSTALSPAAASGGAVSDPEHPTQPPI